MILGQVTHDDLGASYLIGDESAGVAAVVDSRFEIDGYLHGGMTSRREDGLLPDSTHTPYHDLHAMPAPLDPARPIAVICASGQRVRSG